MSGYEGASSIPPAFVVSCPILSCPLLKPCLIDFCLRLNLRHRHHVHLPRPLLPNQLLHIRAEHAACARHRTSGSRRETHGRLGAQEDDRLLIRIPPTVVRRQLSISLQGSWYVKRRSHIRPTCLLTLPSAAQPRTAHLQHRP